jgi:hypothetical protein
MRKERGQSILLVIVGMSIFVIGAVGLAVDGANMYAHRQMAQAAADAAAQAGIMSIYDGTNTGANAFGTGPFACTATDARTPCVYAKKNSFGGTGVTGTGVDVDFPTSAPGVNLSGTDAVNLIRVAVYRTLNNGLIRFVGPATSQIKAIGVAAIIDVVAPVPIIVTHPNLSGALSSNGNPSITICGGPARSIQVNSTSATSLSLGSNTTIDLSHAGPADPGNCTTGTGADFGNFGGPATKPAVINTGLTGKYVQPASPILDPLALVTPPVNPGGSEPPKTSVANGVSGCPASPPKPCMLYSPGLYPNGIQVKDETAVFKPGVYYITSKGFSNAANGVMVMATGFPADPATGLGMLVYNTGNGTFDVGSNSSASLVGPDLNSVYKGILFFQDRTAAAHAHSLGGGGSLSLKGTIYITNTLAIMKVTPTQYQSVTLQGNSGSSTIIDGEIIAGALTLGGTPDIRMNLNAGSTLHIRQVALVR